MVSILVLVRVAGWLVGESWAVLLARGQTKGARYGSALAAPGPFSLDRVRSTVEDWVRGGG